MTLSVCKLGRQPYDVTYQAMREFTEQRTETTPDELWLVEHPPIFTMGRAADAAHLLAPGEIPVVNTDRGGQVTYHGPGQIVIYLLLDLEQRGLGVQRLVRLIEAAMIQFLASLDIVAQVHDGAPGVYVGDKKIGSLGLRVVRARSYHGLSLNVDMDLAPFTRINPCGYQGLQMTQVADFIPAPNVGALSDGLLDVLQAALEQPVKPVETPS